jgi:predicted transcriptional regulator
MQVVRVPRNPPSLSKRERQIMDIVYRRGSATAAEIHADLPDAPTYTTVRGLLRVLEEKGHLVHREDGRRFVYAPTAARGRAGASHLGHVVNTFFGGSPSDAVAALLGTTRGRLSTEELDRLEQIVAQARRKS